MSGLYDLIKDPKVLKLVTDAVKNDPGTRFQEQVADFIKTVNPTNVVETGVQSGVSTHFILKTLSQLKEGLLWSCDPGPDFGLEYLKHPRWRFYKDISLTALPKIYQITGAWDIFMHDSDHEVECQTFEYELGWRFLRPGGYLLSDDYTWSTHRAFQRFCERHNISPKGSFGSCILVEKPATEPFPGVGVDWINAQTLECVRLANSAALDFGLAPKYGFEPLR